jgi:DNA-binding SARP family transcriptional activator
MVSLRILGPVEVWTGDRRLDLGGPRLLGLLAFLVVNANRALSTDALIDAVWGSARAGADNRLQMAIARLRKTLLPLQGDQPILRTVAGGYLLSIGPGELDADVFEAYVQDGRRALADGEPARAAEACRAALDLWRGPPLAEVAFEDFAQGAIRHLEELRLIALETRSDADLRLGGHEEVVTELQGLLVDHPTREHFAAQLMLALYRCGRQADALETYRQTRAYLMEELGLEPGPELRSLQSKILAQDPSLELANGSSHGGLGATAREPGGPDAVSPGPIRAPLPTRVRPYGPPVFVDRLKERETLVAALCESTTLGRRAAFVTGEPGIGKTRLVSEMAEQAHATGTLVLAGRCDNALDIPYQPFVDALEYLVEHAPGALLDGHVAEYGDSVARLVPALAARVFDTPTVAEDASESERYVLFRAIEGLLAAACALGPVLLVVEDLHWADVPTLKLLRRLLTSPRSPPLMLLSTARVTELADDDPLRELLADLHREPHALRIELEGLETLDVVELLRGMTETAAEPADHQLARTLEVSTNGNPFFITELVRSLSETGALVNEDGRWQLASGVDAAGRLPVSVTETLAGRLRRMDESVQRCLRLAAVLGEEFDLELMSQITDRDAAAEALDRATKDAVLIEVPGEPGHFTFVHALMQRYLYRELSSAHRTDLHKQVAIALETRLGEGRTSVAEVAQHWLAAGDAEHENALRYAVRAGDEALAKLAPDEARRWYQISLELLGRQRDPSGAQRCDLLTGRGEAERQAGERGFRQSLLEAAAIARRISDGPRLVRAALANTRGMQSATGIVDEARIETLDAALQIVREGDPATRARLLAMQAAELMYSQEWDRRVALSDEALAIARTLDDPEALTTVLNMRFVTLLAPETQAERRANTVEALEAAERLSDPLARFYAYHWLSYASIEAGDIASAQSWSAREREIADQFRQPTTLWLASADQANLAIVAGDLEAADRLASCALEIGQHGEPDALACYAAQETSIAFESGRLGDLIPLLEEAVDGNPGVPGFRATLALALSEGSRPEEARKILDQAAHSKFRDLPYDVTWLAVSCIYAHVCSELEDVAAAATLYAMLAPWSEQIAFPAFGVWGPVGLYLGPLARVIGELDLAVGHLSEAAQAASRAGAPLWEARAASQLERLAATSQ